MKRKICIITTSRADYGVLHQLISEIKKDRDLILQIIAAGMHTSPEFGLTFKEIEDDGFIIDRKIEMLLSSDTAKSTIKSIAVGLFGFAEAIEELGPDFVVLLGDRFELLSAAISALSYRIPVVHIHGGETSQGAIDEAVRHSITKIASVHFCSTEIYRKRLIRMGENPAYVFNYGAPGLDRIYSFKYLKKSELFKHFCLDEYTKTAIVTYHPVTLEKNSSILHINNILKAIKLSGIQAVFTMSNADTDGRIINKLINEFCSSNPEKYKFIKNLGQFYYFNCLKNFDLMIGNSSSGIAEAPSFKLPVVNVGDRQKGRIRAKNVIDTDYSFKKILIAIKKACSLSFKRELENIVSPFDPYMDGKISLRIVQRLKKIKINSELIKKKFYDEE